jgi:parallel beta-helix repeat protein
MADGTALPLTVKVTTTISSVVLPVFPATVAVTTTIPLTTQSPQPRWDAAWAAPHRATRRGLDDLFSYLGDNQFTGVAVQYMSAGVVDEHNGTSHEYGEKTLQVNGGGTATGDGFTLNADYQAWFRVHVLDQALIRGIGVGVAVAWANTYAANFGSFDQTLTATNAYDLGFQYGSAFGDHSALRLWILGGHNDWGTHDEPAGIWSDVRDGLATGGGLADSEAVVHLTSHEPHGHQKYLNDSWNNAQVVAIDPATDVDKVGALVAAVVAEARTTQVWVAPSPEGDPNEIRQQAAAAFANGAAGVLFTSADRAAWTTEGRYQAPGYGRPGGALWSLGSSAERAVTTIAAPFIVQAYDPPVPSTATTIAVGAAYQSVVDAAGDGANLAFAVGQHTGFSAVVPRANQTFWFPAGAYLDGQNSLVKAFDLQKTKKGVSFYYADVRNYAPAYNDAVMDLASQDLTDSGTWRASLNTYLHKCTIKDSVGDSASYAVLLGSGSTMRYGRVTNSKGVGVGGYGQDMSVEGVEIDNNCPIPKGAVAGGARFRIAHRLSFVGCNVHDNGGPGLWIDLNSDNCTVAYCRVDGNGASGIRYETSRRGSIHSNRIVGNGISDPTQQPFFGGAVFLSTAWECTVEDNELRNNAFGLWELDQHVRRNYDNTWSTNNTGNGSGEYGPRWGDNPSIPDTPPFGRLPVLYPYERANVNENDQVLLWYSGYNVWRRNRSINSGKTGGTVSEVPWASAGSVMYQTAEWGHRFPNTYIGDHEYRWAQGDSRADTAVTYDRWVELGQDTGADAQVVPS